jgi:hypothetical protein
MKKYLEFYNQCVDSGWCPFLCNHFGSAEPLFSLFVPNKQEMMEHLNDGFESFAWGSMVAEDDGQRFNAFRQNIVLFMAAMNNEL